MSPRSWISARVLLPAMGAATLLFVVLPIIGLVERVPWGSALERLARSDVLDAILLSLTVSASAVGISLVLGFPAAWTLARVRFPARTLLRTLVLLPMVLPPVVGGVALLATYGQRGFMGEHLAAIGIRLPYTTLGAVVAVTFVSCPFMILTLESGLRALNQRYEHAASTLGAGDWAVLRRVVLPALSPSVRAGVALTWARALGEFGATIAFAGSHPSRTRTLPLAIYEASHADFETAFLLGLVLVGVSLVVLIGVGGRSGAVLGARP